MAIPTRTNASFSVIERFPLTGIFDTSDANPVFLIQDGDSPEAGIVINFAAFLDANGKLALGNALAAASVTNAMLAGSITAANLAGSIAGTKLSTGISHLELLAGVDETTSNVTLAAMAVGDEINAVIVLTTAASIATAAIRAAGDFVPGAGVMVSTANKAVNTGNQYLVLWTKHT